MGKDAAVKRRETAEKRRQFADGRRQITDRREEIADGRRQFAARKDTSNLSPFLAAVCRLFSAAPSYFLLFCFLPDFVNLRKMGSFRQHMTCSTAAGVALGGIAYAAGFAPPVCAVSAGLCSFAGMLPDIDSNTSRSFQECIYLASGLGCLLFVQRLRQFGWESDSVILGGVLAFLLIRFAGGGIVRKITSHRGMIHSIPMAVFAGEVTFFMTVGSVQDRVLKAAALTLGYLSHLILDEICSIDSTGRIPRLKKSFGTALKWSDPKRKLPVLLLYTLVICLGYAALTHPEVVEHLNSVTAESAGTLLPVFLNPAENAAKSTAAEAAEFLRQKGTTPEPARKYAVSALKETNADVFLFSRGTQPSVPPETINNRKLPGTENSPAMPVGDGIMMDFP
ncbi:MAG: metal-dependent hydrolase [Planctomycetaceae bacterium]|jgi:membrane-bound metal-dependent hydrolase YbcI (DUF457 family)|nr:metal-dependent hydrolase [Planctomycetaceae bacterium]